MEVKTPIIHPNVRALDFGAGFYATSSESQAGKWAKIVTKRRGAGNATLNIFALCEEKLSTMKILKFETANAGWLDFVVKNRKEQKSIPFEISDARYYSVEEIADEWE